MAEEREQQRPLRNLLENVYTVHRNDIKTYASGHLNPSKLLKSEDERHKAWESSNKPPIRLKQPSQLVNLPTHRGMSEGETKATRMRDMLIEFSLGPVGSTLGAIGPQVIARDDEDGISPKPDEMELKTKPINVEELRLPEIMVPVAHKGKQGKEGGYQSTFVESYLAQSTKADQFASFKDFEENVINLGHANDRGVLTGEKMARTLGRKLNKKLNALDSSSQRGPNFHKLQIFTDVWQDIINQSDTFGDVLQKIKDEYDNYMSYLLDAQRPSQHRMLYRHLESLTQDQATTAELKKEQERVKRLETQARQLLCENARLREILREEENLALEEIESVPKEPQSKGYIHVEEVPKDLEEQINDLHAQILGRLDAIEGLKKYQHEHCVPISVCHHLEQCIKETEVDIQKTIKNNEFLEKSIEDLEIELSELLEKSGSKESDSRKLWKKINNLEVIKFGKEQEKKL
ncbi:uncharacterized protein C6orf118 [Nematostella vectensis]|uniref:uncharacterized protein C6orf118 n=1 Tax=Nematostella vectensis TaxID=45351 RepID=UPI002077420B|nr:uncharacterized protein C6orf118 [Nematostella vectensis]